MPLLAAMPGIADSDDPRATADLVTSAKDPPLAFRFHPANVPYPRVTADQDTTNLGPLGEL
jgi:hypothetical protein